MPVQVHPNARHTLSAQSLFQLMCPKYPAHIISHLHQLKGRATAVVIKALKENISLMCTFTARRRGRGRWQRPLLSTTIPPPPSAECFPSFTAALGRRLLIAWASDNSDDDLLISASPTPGGAMACSPPTCSVMAIKITETTALFEVQALSSTIATSSTVGAKVDKSVSTTGPSSSSGGAGKSKTQMLKDFLMEVYDKQELYSSFGRGDFERKERGRREN